MGGPRLEHGVLESGGPDPVFCFFLQGYLHNSPSLSRLKKLMQLRYSVWYFWHGNLYIVTTQLIGVIVYFLCCLGPLSFRSQNKNKEMGTFFFFEDELGQPSAFAPNLFYLICSIRKDYLCPRAYSNVNTIAVSLWLQLDNSSPSWTLACEILNVGVPYHDAQKMSSWENRPLRGISSPDSAFGFL